MGTKFLKIIAWAALIELALAAVAEAADSQSPGRKRADASQTPAAVYYVLPTYRRNFTGGWYAQNYHYYFGHAPLVNHNDPYDYNGNYFPSEKR